MNIVKINADIVKALYDSNPNRIAAYREEDESIFITTTGSYGFWLRKDQVLFNLNKVRLLEKPLFNPDDFVSDMQEIVPTDDFKKAGKDFIQKFVSKRPYGGEDWHTWINSSFLRPLARETGGALLSEVFQRNTESVSADHGSADVQVEQKCRLAVEAADDLLPDAYDGGR